MDRWTKQTPFTAPGDQSGLSSIGPEVEHAVTAVQGLLIHGEAAEYYGLVPSAFSRETLPVEMRLAAILAADDRPLNVERAPQDRALGTCRDYAVLMCSAMREHGRPARVRCGFASYLGGAPWEDHWICELWSEARWRRIDAQLDPILQDALATQFSPADMSPDTFLTGDEAWRHCRAGLLDAGNFGHGKARGVWFMYVNLLRDRFAVMDQFISAWDDWRAAASRPPELSIRMLTLADELASGDPSEAPTVTPWWR